MKGSFIITLLLAMLVTVGCSVRYETDEGPAPGVHAVGPNPSAGIRMNTVNIIDKSLQNWPNREGSRCAKIAVERTNATRTPTNTIRVFAVLRNRTDYPLQIEGRVQFFDAAQAPIEGPTAWKRVYLPPNSVATYEDFSTRTDVTYYYIEIREGR